jgi:ABC-type phosphate transport system permease subunit
MKSPAQKIAGLIVLFLFSHLTHLFSQATSLHVFQEWAKNEGLTNHTYKARTVNDAYGHIYIIGGTISASGDYDWLLTKRNQWCRDLVSKL